MTVIVDYGVGNLFSLTSSLAVLGEEVTISKDSASILSAPRIILPGVGAFADAAEKLRASGLDSAVKTAAENGTPLLGICLGMQLLFNRSFEFGEHKGLGLIPGDIMPFKPQIGELKVPQMGWNRLRFTDNRPASRLFRYIKEGDFVYFVHSYSAVDCEDYVTATTDYGIPLTAAAENGNVYGTQFHPEKSGSVGLSVLKAFLETD